MLRREILMELGSICCRSWREQLAFIPGPFACFVVVMEGQHTANGSQADIGRTRGMGMIHDGPGGNAQRVMIKCNELRFTSHDLQRFWLVRARASLALGLPQQEPCAKPKEMRNRKKQIKKQKIKQSPAADCRSAVRIYLYQEAGGGCIHRVKFTVCWMSNLPSSHPH